MNRNLILCTVLLCMLELSAYGKPAIQVNGRLEVRGDHTILHVWGTHYEMGFAHGYLLSEEIMHLVNNYLGTFITPVLYQAARPLFENLLYVPEPYDQEIQGIYDGIKAAGTDLYIYNMRKDLDTWDVMMANAVADLSSMFNLLACSSTLGWGEATLIDPEVNGGSLLCRDMDFTDTRDYTLANSSLLITYEPSDPSEQEWISVGFPGYIGCLSGMNAQGVAAVQHVGNDPILPLDGTRNVSINLAMRIALEQKDYDEDGQCTIMDVFNAVQDHERPGSYEIPVAMPNLAGLSHEPIAVIEARHGEAVIRWPSDSADKLSNYVMGATNHHRKLTVVDSTCRRYDIIEDMLQEDLQVDTEEVWQIETAARQSSTIHTMTFRPDLMDFYLAFKKDEVVACNRVREYYHWSDLFPNHSDVPPMGDIFTTEQIYRAGDTFRVSARYRNVGYSRDVRIYIGVEIEGNFYFYPSFTEKSEFQIKHFPTGYTSGGDILAFPLKAPVPAVDMTWYLAMVDAQTGQLLGDVDLAPCQLR